LLLYSHHSFASYHKFAEASGGRNSGFIKKNKFKKHAQINNSYIDNVLRGVGFKTGKKGPELYDRTIERLGQYASIQFKNGADVMKCLMAGKVVKPKSLN
jgi:hypothetical protein